MDKKESSKCIDDKEIPYQLKLGDTRVFFEYSNNSKTFKECIFNILNKKNKMG